MNKLAKFFAAMAVILNASQTLAKNNWQIVAAESEIAFVVLIGGAETTGTFGDWSADITFCPEAIDRAEVSVTVDISSVTISHPEARAVVGSTVWLSFNDHPTAQFVGICFTDIGDNKLEMPGMLSLKGISLPTLLVGEITIEGDLAIASFSTTLSRSAHVIGDENPLISDGVTVTANLVAICLNLGYS